MENFLYAIRDAKEIKIVDINFDLFRYSMDATEGDLLITYDELLGIAYYYLFRDTPKKCEPSWKNIKIRKCNTIDKRI